MKKILHLEVIRIIAVLFVMFIHSGYWGRDAYSCTDSRMTFVVSLILACMTAIGVNLFWMVSGSLLIGKNEDAKIVYTKRIPRIVVVLLLFSVIRYVYDWFMGVYGGNYYWSTAYGANAGAGLAKLEILDFIRKFLYGTVFLPYWFLYSYIAILLLLPFIRKMIQGMKATEWRYLAILEVVFLIFIKFIEMGMNISFAVPFFIPEAVNAFILGYAAEKVIPQKWLEKWKNLLGIVLFIILFVGIEYYATVTIGNPVGQERKVFTDAFTTPIAFGVVLFIRGLSYKIGDCPKWLSKVVSFAGGCAFGIYLIEDYLRQFMIFVYEKTVPVITVMPACFIWPGCSFIVGLLVVGVLKKIPGLGRYI